MAKKELPSRYNPHGLENKWYPVWEKDSFFSHKKNDDQDKSRPTFSIVIPPPNVTGSLHLGHALNHTIQDILTRWNRMKGNASLWVPGTDHAGIATQNVVERLLAKEGKKRWEMSREEFEERVWKWKAESGGMIIHQMRELGESVNWDYERFTLDEGSSRLVKKVFVRLYNEKLIYRGERIINWCPHDETALSNIEVEYRERSGKLYSIRYPLLSEEYDPQQHAGKEKEFLTDEYLTVATTRPETMLGDEAVAVHPEDERYSHLHKRFVLLPLLDKPIPVVADSYVDREYGTGVVKITPAHDPNDFEVGARHKLPITRVFDDAAHINDLGGKYAGLSREEARKKVVSDLEELELLEEVKEIKHSVGECYRCGTVVEPLTSLQWFVDVKPLARDAIDVVKSGEIRFIPKRWENTYFEWMNNIQDWCISRQLWWGHRIPAYYCEDCGHVHVSEEDVKKCEKCGSENIRPEEDVLDTWFSSGLWPFSTLMSRTEDGVDSEWSGEIPQNEDLNRFYPTSVLVTGFDIIFFWVARMIMFGTHIMKKPPFRDVYIHGLVRDASRQKMSKSKGNVVNPLEKMEEYGTDAFRFFLMSILPEGKDIVFDESRLKGYQAFANKIWNTARYIWMNQEEDYHPDSSVPEKLTDADLWILTEFNLTLQKVNTALESYRFADYTSALYDFIWKSFCDHYVELSKIQFRNEAQVDSTRFVLNNIFLKTMQLLHPVMPFITEELYSFWPRTDKEDLIITSQWPELFSVSDKEAGKRVEQLIEIVYHVRRLRGELEIPTSEKIRAAFLPTSEQIGEIVKSHSEYVTALARLDSFEILSSAPAEVKAVLDSGTLFLYVKDLVDAPRERERLSKELEHLRKGIQSTEGKLANEGFIARAPAELVEEERAKLDNYRRKISEIEELLSAIG